MTVTLGKCPLEGYRGIYLFAMCKCFVEERWILMSCSSINVVWGVSCCVKDMLFLTYVKRPPPCLCKRSVLIGVKWQILGVLWCG